MKLLLDANLSYRLVKKLQPYYEEIRHVSSIGLGGSAADRIIWEWAKQNGFAIITNDEDFQDFAILYGYPPKVLLLRTGNQSSAYLCQLLIDKQLLIANFMADDGLSVLEIY